METRDRLLLPRRNESEYRQVPTQGHKNLEDPSGDLSFTANALTTNRPLLLSASKDKPVLISALAAKCNVLLTLDTGDFGIVLDTKVYGMAVRTPRSFLIEQGLG